MEYSSLVSCFLLVIAGFFGGMLNAIAGGGSFITFPALLFAGVPPIAANATNTFASCSGYISGAYAFRRDLWQYKKELPRFIAISLFGGSLGAWLLLQTSDTLFREAIPWLLLLSTMLFACGSRLYTGLQGLTQRYEHGSFIVHLFLFIMLVGVCVYGGFFNAGLGIIILSYLVLAGYENINAMNGIKLLVSTAVSLIAIVLFILNGVIVWFEGGLVLLGTLIGGYFAARLSRRISQKYLKIFVSCTGAGITIYFFYDTYWAFPR